MAQLGGTLSHTSKGRGFDSQSGHTSSTHVVGSIPDPGAVGGNQSMSVYYIDVSLFLSLKSIKIYHWARIRKNF